MVKGEVKYFLLNAVFFCTLAERSSSHRLLLDTVLLVSSEEDLYGSSVAVKVLRLARSFRSRLLVVGEDCVEDFAFLIL